MCSPYNVHYLGRPCVQCTQNGYIVYTSRKKVALFDLIYSVTIWVYYLGRPLVRCSQNEYIRHTSRQKVASV